MPRRRRKVHKRRRHGRRAGGLGHIANVISRGTMALGRTHAGRILGRAAIARGVKAITG
jgi:hypothetical protein